MQLGYLQKTIFVLIATTIGLGPLCYAETKTSTSTTKTKAFDLMTSVTYSQSLYNYQDGTQSKGNEYIFKPSYNWGPTKTTLVLGYTQDLLYSEKNDVADLIATQSLKPFELSRFQITTFVGGVAPVSKTSREVTNLEGALMVGAIASIQPKFLIAGFSAAAGLTLSRSFHRYDTKTTGELNTQHALRQTLNLGYEVSAVSFSGEFHHINRWTYAGTTREDFEHAEEAAIPIGEKFSFAIGHTNSGSMLKANGYESNLKLIDDNSSLAYARLELLY